MREAAESRSGDDVWDPPIGGWVRVGRLGALPCQAMAQPVGPWVAAEVEEASQVDGGDPGGQSDAVSFDAAVGDSPVAVGDEPGEGPFDHGPVLAVVVDAGAVSPVGLGRCEEVVVVAKLEGLAVDGRGAALAGSPH